MRGAAHRRGSDIEPTRVFHTTTAVIATGPLSAAAAMLKSVPRGIAALVNGVIEAEIRSAA